MALIPIVREVCYAFPGAIHVGPWLLPLHPMAHGEFLGIIRPVAIVVEV